MYRKEWALVPFDQNGQPLTRTSPIIIIIIITTTTSAILTTIGIHQVRENTHGDTHCCDFHPESQAAHLYHPVQQGIIITGTTLKYTWPVAVRFRKLTLSGSCHNPCSSAEWNISQINKTRHLLCTKVWPELINHNYYCYWHQDYWAENISVYPDWKIWHTAVGPCLLLVVLQMSQAT